VLTFVDPATVKANAFAVARHALGARRPSRAAYFRALGELYGVPIPHRSRDAAPAAVFDLADPALEPLFARIFSAEDRAAMRAVPAAEQGEIRRAMQHALAILADAYPRGAESTSRLLGSIVFARIPTGQGGSFGNALGVIWLNPWDWTDLTFAENLLHEATHQAFSLHEMVHGLYAVDMETRERTLVTSAILRIPRPHDLAWHAAVVAASLADFYTTLGDRDRVAELLSGLAVTVRELEASAEILTDAGREVLEDLAGEAARLDAASVAA
jgi:hypothetical protein